MLEFEQYFQDNGKEKPWRAIPNREGLYVLDNPFVLDPQLAMELQENLEPQADYDYKSPNGWSYRVKINNEGNLSIIGWKAKTKQSGGGYQQKTYSKQSGQAIQQAKQYVDVEVKHTENLSTVNEILANGYMNGENWRVHGVVNMPELVADGKVQVVPHFVLIRKKEFVPVAKTINPPQQQAAQSSGMPE